MKYYAGIGARATPTEVCHLMREFAQHAAQTFILRSGGANGADKAFEAGCNQGGGQCQIFLPWALFNSHPSIFTEPNEQAYGFARRVHPFFHNMKPATKRLVARNMHQILGPNLDDPVDFVICWTPDGCESHLKYNPRITGGTGSAIALASLCDIPVYNIFNDGRLDQAYEHTRRVVVT